MRKDQSAAMHVDPSLASRNLWKKGLSSLGRQFGQRHGNRAMSFKALCKRVAALSKRFSVQELVKSDRKVSCSAQVAAVSFKAAQSSSSSMSLSLASPLLSLFLCFHLCPSVFVSSFSVLSFTSSLRIHAVHVFKPKHFKNAVDSECYKSFSAPNSPNKF